MQVVIEISEQDYELARNYPDVLFGSYGRAIAKGTALPKGHGRLIDANTLEKKMCDREEELGDDEALWESSAVSTALDMFAPTFVEADKEENSF